MRRHVTQWRSEGDDAGTQGDRTRRHLPGAAKGRNLHQKFTWKFRR